MEMKKQNYEIEAKKFFETQKKEIGEGIRQGDNVVKINFQDLKNFSPDVAKYLLNDPEKSILDMNIWFEGIFPLKDPNLIFHNFPEKYLINLCDIRSKHLGNLHTVKGKVIKRDDHKIKIDDIRFECGKCGAIISIIQFGENKIHPKECSCGVKTGFKELSKSFSDIFEITLTDNNKNKIITFSGSFLDNRFNKIIKEGNDIKIHAIIKPQSGNSRVLEWELKPIGVELIKETSGATNIDKLLDSMDSLGKQKGFAFEQLIKKLFEIKGYAVTLTPRSGDFGIDLIAKKGNESIAIQCKMFKSDSKISNSTVQKALGASQSPYNANKVLVITTASEFTDRAIKQKDRNKIPIELWNREKTLSELNAHLNDSDEGWEILNNLESENNYSKKDEYMAPPNHFDIERVSSDVITSKVAKSLWVKEAYLRLENKFKGIIPIEEFEKDLVETGKITSDELEESINQLIRSGDLYRPKKGYIKKI